MNPPAKTGDLYRSANGHHVRILRIRTGMPIASRGEIIGHQATRATLRQCSRTGGRCRKPYIDHEPFYTNLRQGDRMGPGYTFLRNLNNDTKETTMSTTATAPKKTAAKKTVKPAPKKKAPAKKTAAKTASPKAKTYTPRPGSYAAVILDYLRRNKKKSFTRAELQTKLKQPDWGETWPCQQVLFDLSSRKGLVTKSKVEGKTVYQFKA